MFVGTHSRWPDSANASFIQLFFLDSGADAVPADAPTPTSMLSDEEAEDNEEAGQLTAVWHDSDDERLTVSLASQQRLRKLRVAESEDVISGTEYIRRLRKHYQQLHPTPEWANPELSVARSAGVDSDSDRVDDMDTEDESQSSTQPLAKLLQGVTDLTKLEDSTHPGGKRKLRQEMLDIQRLKDVGKDQPVSAPAV